jgi:hypothetical protein
MHWCYKKHRENKQHTTRDREGGNARRVSDKAQGEKWRAQIGVYVDTKPQIGKTAQEPSDGWKTSRNSSQVFKVESYNSHPILKSNLGRWMYKHQPVPVNTRLKTIVMHTRLIPGFPQSEFCIKSHMVCNFDICSEFILPMFPDLKKF